MFETDEERKKGREERMKWLSIRPPTANFETTHISCGVHQLDSVGANSPEDLIQQIAVNEPWIKRTHWPEKPGAFSYYDPLFRDKKMDDERKKEKECQGGWYFANQAFVIFSDIDYEFSDHYRNLQRYRDENGNCYNGERFAQYVRENKLGNVLKSESARNPNSGNQIAVWIWTVDQTALLAWGRDHGVKQD